jgi:quinol monooxygenase YgiN
MYRYIWKIKLNNPADEEKFVKHWKESSIILQTFPGALGTHIHRVRDEVGSFYAVAEWESQEARDAMNEEVNNGTSERDIAWRKFPKNHSFGHTINFAGPEIDVVMPE